MRGKIYKAGVYIRLSREDGNKFEESNSIKNQRELIKQYIEKQEDISIYDYYSDDGKTGTNFERPGFQKMIKDMYDKRIDCIIVKDLSRFGRNYIEVGRYIEYIFPSNNIRFISINDDIDNVKNPDSINNIIVPFKNLMNDEYCRDISRKIKKVREIQRLNGEVTCGSAPYGYILKKKKLYIDEEVKDNIKMIFDLCIAGESTSKIAFKLNELKIDCPRIYHLKKNKKEITKDYYWSSPKINDILKNRVYCGDLVQGKTTTLNNKVKVSIPIPREKWIIKENTHKAIIDRDTFNKAQEILKKNTTAKSIAINHFNTIFKGYLKCYDCHKAMVKKSCVSYNNKKYVLFDCYTYTRISHDLCNKRAININELTEVILKKIKKDINNLIEFEKNILNKISDNEELNSVKDNIKKLENELSEINKLKNETLFDLKRQLISLDDYNFYSESYNSRIREINNSINNLKDKKFELANDEKTIMDFIKKFKKYNGMKELTRETLEDLINVIYIKENKNVEIEYLDNDIYQNIKERSFKWVD